MAAADVGGQGQFLMYPRSPHAGLIDAQQKFMRILVNADNGVRHANRPLENPQFGRT
jgi:hypothetical protein